jgi:hypothetical protein
VYATVRLFAEFGGVGCRGQVDQGLDGAIGHAGEHVGQILADGDREPAAALDDGEDGGDFGAGERIDLPGRTRTSTWKFSS